MIDIKHIRNDLENTQRLLQTKIEDIKLLPLATLDTRIREIKTEVENLKSERNLKSKIIGENKRKSTDCQDLMHQVTQIAERIQILDEELNILEKELLDGLARLPNLPMDDIKVSQDPKDNVCIKTFKEKKVFDFPFKNHVELNETLGLFDFKKGAKISGAGWPVYKNIGARLEWALINYMIEIHLKNGFTQWMVPHLVKPSMMFGSSMLPKFESQIFKLDDKDHTLYLVPTAEVALNGLHFDEILNEEDLPLKYVSYTPCFRREAGAAGSQERGLIRTHQFNKVEMFAFSKPEESMGIFEMMLKSAEEVLQGLDLHYRNMLLVTGDMSFASARTIDIEVWLPGQNRYYEVSSVSNCTDFQARRSQIRFKRKESGKMEFVHTLNGSGLATSRLMVGLIENNQNKDGSVNIPKVLQKYLGQDRIG
jgi:seryl-tRNA synthetase